MDMDSIDAEQERLEKREEQDTLMPDGDSEEKLTRDAQAFLTEQTHQVVIPSYSGWFDMQQVHEIEKKSNPEFFNGRNRSKTPSVYKDYRDFMINTYRLNPIEYLTVTACRRNLAGDVCAVMRVHAFLEQWGLINYQTDSESRPSVIGPPFTGHFRVVADTPRGLQPFQPAPQSTLTTGRPYAKTEEAMTSARLPDLNLELRRDVYTGPSKDNSSNNGIVPNGNTGGNNERKSQFNCFTCGVDCSTLRFHCSSPKKFDLCSNCYHEGRFPSSFQSGDFLKIDSTHAHATRNDSDWSDRETLLLLEGLEMYSEDWQEISAHVGSRTKEQCVLKFLQLPIEDAYLEQRVGDLGPLQYTQAPFSSAENPVMSVVAFLAKAISPEAAAAAAKRSIHATLSTEQAASASAVKDNSSSVATDGQVMQGDNQKQDSSSTETATERAAAIALGTSAAKAKLLAMHEEQKLTTLLGQAVTMQMKKLDLKLAHFEQMERTINSERRLLEVARQNLYLDRLALLKQKKQQQQSQQQEKEQQSVNGHGTSDVPESVTSIVAVQADAEDLSTQVPEALENAVLLQP